MTDPAFTDPGLDASTSLIGYAQGAKSSGLLAVRVGGRTVTVLAARDVTFAAGDRVVIVRMGDLWAAVCRLDTAAVTDLPDQDIPPDPNPATITGTRTFTPVETRSWAGARWRDDTDVYQGQYATTGNHTGAAFYGQGPRALSGATVTSATVRIRRRNGGGLTAAQATTLRLVTEATRPAGAPTLTSSTAGPSLRWAQGTDAAVPASWAQAIVDGTAGGLALYEADGSPYVITDGIGSYSAAWALTINWQRTS
jgi:hypothetical protein